LAEVRLEGVSKYFGRFKALDRVSFTVNPGEFFTLLGPSGCGKTTTLRVIAGFEIPEEGRVYIDGVDVTFKKPYERNTAMVFQNYALWPHMTVFDNVAYGLKVRGYSRDEIRRRVNWALDLLGLKGLENRYPLQLSGGQQQRVALARAIVVEPKVLLLDEPLSNLDARLRIRVREEIVLLQRKLRITAIYVTHDQEEAMSISDRIAVMDRGRIVQIGTPWEVYSNPANLFVATFMGRSNVLDGIIAGREADGLYIVDINGLKLYGTSRESLREGDRVKVVIRNEDAEPLEGDRVQPNVIEGKVVRLSLIGFAIQVKLLLSNGETISVYLRNKTAVNEGERMRVYISPEDVKIYRSLEALAE
jgi:ABC-type spermidine/putrescine transport systems, ATPase components